MITIKKSILLCIVAQSNIKLSSDNKTPPHNITFHLPGQANTNKFQKELVAKLKKSLQEIPDTVFIKTSDSDQATLAKLFEKKN